MRVLDLFCGAGGAGRGYARAGATIIGVDIDPQPSYPYRFMHLDALEFLERMLDGGGWRDRHGDVWRLEHFDFIHASPPCQTHSALTAGNRGRGWQDQHVDLIPASRQLLNASGTPYAIENVQGSTLRKDVTLCGEMFGLNVIRHRYFEFGGWTAEAPVHVPHRGRVAGWRHGVYYEGPYFAVHGDGGGKGSITDWQQAMDIDWMVTKHDLAEAIPPAYTEWVFREWMKNVV